MNDGFQTDDWLSLGALVVHHAVVALLFTLFIECRIGWDTARLEGSRAVDGDFLLKVRSSCVPTSRRWKLGMIREDSLISLGAFFIGCVDYFRLFHLVRALVHDHQAGGDLPVPAPLPYPVCPSWKCHPGHCVHRVVRRCRDHEPDHNV